MSKSYWERTFGAKRRRSDRELLASIEREIAQAEKAAAANLEATARKLAAQEMGLVKDVNGERLPGEPWKQAENEAKQRIARAFGRP